MTSRVRAGRLARFLSIPFLLAAASTALMAQGGRGSDNVLYPQPILPSYVGVDAGYIWWSSKASFGVGDGDLPCAIFGDGKGSGVTVGARLLHNVGTWFMLTPRIRYESRSSTFVTQLADEPIRDAGTGTSYLKQEAQADAHIGAFSADLMVGFTIPKTGVYLALGPSVSLVTGGTYDYTERINGPAGYVYSDNGGTEHMLAEGRSFERFKSVALSARAGLGYVYDLGDLALNPEVLYSLPLSSSLDTPDELKQSGVMAMIGVLFYIGE
jgi:hypothetical protein